MNRDLTDVDPLLVFRCKNRLCRQTFNPSTYLKENEQILYFECPVCGSIYEAHYVRLEQQMNRKVIMLQETPRLTHLGTRLASS
ncbi:MAG: hypothetical protein FK733_08325 [Asgard group archaeon]|nr:hypothetical protein [Asgard group archaeon]